MSQYLLLLVSTARRRYAVRRDDMLEIQLIADTASLPDRDTAGRAVLGVELGPLLDHEDRSQLPRRRALLVPIWRRCVAFLVDQVDSFPEHVAVAPLPKLLREHLREPWATGVLLLDNDLILQIDLRAIARSVLARRTDPVGKS